MLTSMAVAFALCSPSAPIPKDAAPTGLAPRVVELKPVEGKLTVIVTRSETLKSTIGNGAAAPRVIERQISKNVAVELGEVKDLVVATAGGKTLELKDAMEKLKDGGIVVMTSDGKPVDVAFLRLFKDDTLVLSSPELVAAPAVRTIGGIKPLPQPLPGVVPGIQIQIAPGLQPLPPVPVKD